MTELLLVGLGNIGPAYKNTRHNLGIQVLRSWVRQQADSGLPVEDWKEDAGLSLQYAAVSFENTKVHGIFPLTNVNNSGKAVAAFLKYHPMEQSNILMLHDDVELPLGEVKIKAGGSAAGHKGVRSIHESLGASDMPRLRLGVGRPPGEIPLEAYVLAPFDVKERPVVEKMIGAAGNVLTQYLIRISAQNN